MRNVLSFRGPSSRSFSASSVSDANSPWPEASRRLSRAHLTSAPFLSASFGTRCAKVPKEKSTRLRVSRPTRIVIPRVDTAGGRAQDDQVALNRGSSRENKLHGVAKGLTKKVACRTSRNFSLEKAAKKTTHSCLFLLVDRAL